MSATKTAKSKPVAAPAASLTAIVAVGAKVKFLGYSEKPEGKPKLKEGDVVFITEYFPDDGGSYNVSRKAGGKPVDGVIRSEFEVLSEPQTLATEAGDQLTTNIETEPEKPGVRAPAGKKPKAKKTSKAERLAAAQKAKAEKKAAKAKEKADAKAKKEAAKAAKKAERDAAKAEREAKNRLITGPVTKSSSVKTAIAEAGNDPIAAAERLQERVEGEYYTLGGVLAVIAEKDAQTTLIGKDDQPLFAKGQRGFAAFVEEHMGMRYRKAAYLVRTYTTFSALGISEARLKGIGWTKIREALDLITADNAQEILTLAKDKGMAAFKVEIKKRLIASGKRLHGHTNPDTVNMTTFKFRVFNDQAEVLNASLTLAAQKLGIADPAVDKTQFGPALMHIVSEWKGLQD